MIIWYAVAHCDKVSANYCYRLPINILREDMCWVVHFLFFFTQAHNKNRNKQREDDGDDNKVKKVLCICMYMGCLTKDYEEKDEIGEEFNVYT